jgi:hypothetical protein
MNDSLLMSDVKKLKDSLGSCPSPPPPPVDFNAGRIDDVILYPDTHQVPMQPESIPPRFITALDYSLLGQSAAHL